MTFDEWWEVAGGGEYESCERAWNYSRKAALLEAADKLMELSANADVNDCHDEILSLIKEQ